MPCDRRGPELVEGLRAEFDTLRTYANGELPNSPWMEIDPLFEIVAADERPERPNSGDGEVSVRTPALSTFTARTKNFSLTRSWKRA